MGASGSANVTLGTANKKVDPAGSANVALFAANKKVDLARKLSDKEEIAEIAEALKNKECVVQTLDISCA